MYVIKNHKHMLRLGLTRRAGSVLQDEPEPLSSRLDLRSSRGLYYINEIFFCAISLADYVHNYAYIHISLLDITYFMVNNVLYRP